MFTKRGVPRRRIAFHAVLVLRPLTASPDGAKAINDNLLTDFPLEASHRWFALHRSVTRRHPLSPAVARTTDRSLSPSAGSSRSLGPLLDRDRRNHSSGSSVWLTKTLRPLPGSRMLTQAYINLVILPPVMYTTPSELHACARHHAGDRLHPPSRRRLSFSAQLTPLWQKGISDLPLCFWAHCASRECLKPGVVRHQVASANAVGRLGHFSHRRLFFRLLCRRAHRMLPRFAVAACQSPPSTVLPEGGVGGWMSTGIRRVRP